MTLTEFVQRSASLRRDMIFGAVFVLGGAGVCYHLDFFFLAIMQAFVSGFCLGLGLMGFVLEMWLLSQR